MSTFVAPASAKAIPAPLAIHQIAEPIALSPAATDAPMTIGNLLPDSAIAVILIDTTAAKWEALSRFGIFPKDFSFPGALYPTPLKVDFYTDVRPWLGGSIAYVYLPAPQPQLTTVAMVKDAAPIARFLDQVKASRVKPAKERQYKGVTLLEWEPENPLDILDQDQKAPLVMPAPQLSIKAHPDLKKPVDIPLRPRSAPSSDVPPNSPFAPKGLAIAVLPNHIISSPSVEAVQQVIDAQLTNAVLANLPTFQRTLARSQAAKSLIVAYGDYEKSFSAILAYDIEQLQKLAPGITLPQFPEKLSGKESYESVDGFVWAEPDGLHLQFGANLKTPLPAIATRELANPNQILEQLPGTNYMVANSRGLATIWKLLTLAIETQPMLKPKLAQFRQLSQTTIGLDDRDIFPWMDGEYATFAYPTRQGFLPATGLNLDVGFGLMVQTSDRAAAEVALTKLDRFAQQKFGSPFVNAQPSFTSWDAPISGTKKSVFAHGWVKPDTLVLLGGGGALSEVTVKPNQTLRQSANFKAAIAPLPTENFGYSYVNGGAVLSLVNNSILPMFLGTNSAPYLDELKASLGSIRSLSGTTSLNAQRFQTDGFMALATTRPEPISLREPEEPSVSSESRKLTIGSATPQGLADSTQAIQLHPKTTAAYLGRARVDAEQAEQAALMDLDQAIQADPAAAGVYTLRANLRARLEEYEGAIADADHAIRQDKFDRDAYNIRCYARARGLKDFKAALPDCETAIALDSKSPAHYTSRCYVRAGLKDEQALEDCEQALNLDPDYDYNYEDRGLAKALLGDKKGALEDLQRVLGVARQRGDAVAEKRIEKAIQMISNAS
ncbi:DUF3352 domain-containing protein [Myxacorys almedinensis]|nr:DUF3352 domain-containing protein [Myxacorys almedinensis]